MNDKLQYAEMLEIPVNSCNITVKPSKRKKQKKSKELDKVKQQLIEKVNDKVLNEENDLQENNNDTPKEDYQSSVIVSKTKKERKKPNIIAIQLAIIGVLIATICLTTMFVPESGLLVFFNNVFGNEQVEKVDDRLYVEFAPNLPVTNLENLLVDEGIMCFSGNGSIYSPCDGKVTNMLVDENGKYTLCISFSNNFSSIFKGLDYAYCSLNDTVYSNIPIGYILNGDATMCFTDFDGSVITNYTINDGNVVWAV